MEQKNLKELLKQENYPEEFRDIVPDYPMNLLEIQRFEHLERFQTDLYLVFGFLQRRWDKEKLREFIEKNKERFQDLREDAYDVIQAYGKVSALKKIKEVCRTKTGGYDMCQAWNEIMEEERMKGKEMGLRLGEKKGERRGEKRGEKRGVSVWAGNGMYLFYIECDLSGIAKRSAIYGYYDAVAGSVAGRIFAIRHCLFLLLSEIIRKRFWGVEIFYKRCRRYLLSGKSYAPFVSCGDFAGR